jgi:hypothetical protein
MESMGFYIDALQRVQREGRVVPNDDDDSGE